jgi:hypothetical protein
MGQIIASDLFKKLAAEEKRTNLFGYSDYFEVEVEDCSPDTLYIVIGKEKDESQIERQAYCACGNGICDGLENIGTCPEDCRIVEKPFISRLSLTLLGIMLLLILIGGAAIIIYKRRKKRMKKALLKSSPPARAPPSYAQ